MRRILLPMMVPKQVVAGAPSLPPYSAEAVQFSTGDYLTKAGTITGLADSTTHTHSYWFYPQTGYTTSFFFGSYLSGLGEEYLVYVGTTGTVGISCNGGGVWNYVTAGSLVVFNQWNHIMVARSGTTGQVYINDVDASGGTAPTSTATDLAAANWSIGARPDGSIATVSADAADIWFTTEYIDISVTANRRKFIDANGDPVDLGSDGSTPTGTAAPLFFKGVASTWNAGTNSGSGEDFTIHGAVADSGVEPVGLP